jgi:L-threonylcarbamoyladenylate synthase
MSERASTDVLPTHTPALFDQAVTRAVALLQAGEVVALPTETVYGLAANAWNARAVEQIFLVKGRPSNNPVIVHVGNLAMAQACASEWPAAAESLAEAFWPGPLTLVLPKAAAIPDIVTANGSTVGIRWPSHPFMQAVIQRCGFPLAAPSANPAGHLSPTNAGHVLNGLGGAIRLIVDGGQSQVGIESTVLDLTTSPPRLLRPGMIHADALLAVLGERAGIQSGSDANTTILRSPGMLDRHYSPRARLVVRSWVDEADLALQMRSTGLPAGQIHVIAHSRIPLRSSYAGVSVIPLDAEAFARALYAELHRCDEAGVKLIVVEEPPASAEWSGIADRLRRASS